MEKDIDLVMIKFRDTAARLSSLLWEDFTERITKLNRRTDENVVQQLQSRYTEELKNQLTQTADQLIQQLGRNRQIASRELTSLIAYYASELVLKMKSG